MKIEPISIPQTLSELKSIREKLFTAGASTDYVDVLLEDIAKGNLLPAAEVEEK